MKMRLTAMLMAIALLVCTVGTAMAADAYDLTFVKESDYYKLTEDLEEEVAYIESTFSDDVSAIAFTHQYESSEYYSYAYSDIILLDCPANPQPIWRMWITVQAQKPLNINSVTFTVDGKDYTFSEISNPDRVSQNDNGDTREELLIRFDNYSVDFLIALEQMVNSCESAQEIIEKEIKVVLHGDEDIETVFNGNIWFDWFAVKNAMSEGNGFIHLFQKTDGTPVTVTDAK